MRDSWASMSTHLASMAALDHHHPLRLGYWFSDGWRREHVSCDDHSSWVTKRSVNEKWIWMMCFKHVDFYQHSGKWSMMTTLRFSVCFISVVGWFRFLRFLCTLKPDTNWTCAPRKSNNCIHKVLPRIWQHTGGTWYTPKLLTVL